MVHIGNMWRDQLRATGHHARPADLDLVAGLGIRTLRVPVLWERCTAGPAWCGWDWHDAYLARLDKLGIKPIIGLLHHGSGPPGWDLRNPALAEALALHAGLAASRYPWVDAWTPVNEPLTTARFCGQYGHWYPHARTEPDFLLMLATQCRAILLSMRAIRAHIPNARLVQTEDLGRMFSTAPLKHQADYENERRWLSLDMLQGRVDRAHRFYDALRAAGVTEAWLADFRTAEAMPDVIGINHYVTSDRFLDHRTELYPPHLVGSNGRDSYADIEAIRAPRMGQTGWTARLREVWARYHRPMAITEVHLACADEAEPVRWFAEAWNAALALREEGAEVQAVTAWALFGAVDWDSLLRDERGHAEAGVWDGACDPPRPTQLADALQSLVREGHLTHPALSEPGWWQRDERLINKLRLG